MAPEVAYIRVGNPERLRPIGGGADILLNVDSDGFSLGNTQPSAFWTGPKGTLANYGSTFTPSPNTETTPYHHLTITSMVDCSTPGDYWFEDIAFRPTTVTATARGVINGNYPNVRIHLKRFLIRPQRVVDPANPDVASNQLTGIYAHDFEAERGDVSGTTDGFATQQTGRIRGCYVHDLAYRYAGYQTVDLVTHNDGFQVFAGDGSEWIGNYSDLRPDPVFSDRSAPSSSSTGGIGQHIAITPTIGNAPITNLHAEDSWIDYGFRGIGGAASSNPARNGGSIYILRNRFGPNIASFPVQGYGSTRRPIIVAPEQNLIGLPATGLGVADTNNGNVNYDGTPILVYRQTP